MLIAMSALKQFVDVRIGARRVGAFNAITDVPGVLVGHVTLISGEGTLRPGRGPIRTGVTIIVPHESIWHGPIFAGAERINGNGELTGLEWVRESGLLTTPIAITNTHSVGVVRDALARIQMRQTPRAARFSLPVVGETYDGYLNDINGQHLTADHVEVALAGAKGGPVSQGAVGGGTGMVCHGFKGGIGTASRLVDSGCGCVWSVGVLVQANHGVRERLVIDGIPVGKLIGPDEVPLPSDESAAAGEGSIIIVVATDAPLLPHQCAALAKRTSFGLARTGGAGEHNSGDFAVAFSTAARLSASPGSSVKNVATVIGDEITPLYYAVIEATEHAIVNALLSAETMTGVDGHTAHRLPPERLASILRSANKQVAQDE
jgi:D-aminopeptidase